MGLVFVSHTKAITHLLQIVTYMQLQKKNGGIKGYNGM